MLCVYAALYDLNDFGGLNLIHSLRSRSLASIRMKIQNLVAMCDEAGITRQNSGTGVYAGRTATSGNGTRFYDANGAFNGRSTVNGNSTRFYDSRGAFAGRAETSGGSTRYYDAQGRFSGSKR